ALNSSFWLVGGAASCVSRKAMAWFQESGWSVSEHHTVLICDWPGRTATRPGSLTPPPAASHARHLMAVASGSPDNLPSLRATKAGVEDDGAGQGQVPPGTASHPLPTLQDAHESTQDHSSP